jgi:23S rRNA (adenine2503-C2)-methyltransferase
VNLDLLKTFLSTLQEPDYRYRQIVKNYYSSRFSSFSDMTDLPKDLRANLQSKIPLLSLSLAKISLSGHTQKALLQLADNQTIESVLMDYGQWLTACVSSQIGCPLACKFCATGQMGFIRNLTVEEIIDQIIFWNQKVYPKYIGRIVFMGMGEPFLNWDNLLSALSIINSPNGLNVGSRKISISTAGIVPKIKEFTDLNTEINLAISLHSLDQKTRQSIMPVAKQYPLPELLDACLYYVNQTHRQLFFEYALIQGVNDRPADLQLIV